MLLLVMQAELDEGCGFSPRRLRTGALDEPGHRRPDMVAIGADDVDRRARQQAALRPRMPRPGRLRNRN